ncbi:hypothetical protein ADIS_3388 [Lunatimonas lonarensis]|uniref:Uncharacterized protein n=1 Tax=Lunatimonas lonarensis TaxID=1232681 RepID=R7ZQ69_9BACT|nr:hypothetical protein ADIS_3388 [Lunatimonas lonarensis]
MLINCSQFFAFGGTSPALISQKEDTFSRFKHLPTDIGLVR